MTDRINFEPLSNLGAPRGLYLGLTIPFPKDRWSVDVWFVIADKVAKDEMSKLIEQATNEQKAVILEIKYRLTKGGQKQKGVTSAEVYKAVLKQGVKSTGEFLALAAK